MMSLLKTFNSWGLLLFALFLAATIHPVDSIANQHASRKEPQSQSSGRERLSLNSGWRFQRTLANPDGLIYDQRFDPAGQIKAKVLKSWILPSGNDFISDPEKRHQRPATTLESVPFTEKSFDDSAWEAVSLPHDWAIKGPFYVGDGQPVKGGMGRLPSQGIAWYRRSIQLGPEDKEKSVYLDIDGAMSYSMVWFNGNLVGGWPYGYNSYRLDLTPYVKLDGENTLAIRLDQPIESSRWYPGGGLYRNVWLTKADPTHISQWGTFVTTEEASAKSAKVKIIWQVENQAKTSRKIEVVTEVHLFDAKTGRTREKVAETVRTPVDLPGGGKRAVTTLVNVKNPQLWGPPPAQKPNMYVAITSVFSGNKLIDSYETKFGIRSVEYSGDKGLLVNGQHVRIQGVNQHHDLGSLGSAFNQRAAERQLEVLQELGCNAIRMSHNPPAPELLDLTDRMGFVVIDEIFDMWEKNKTTSDFSQIFADWHEPDLRSFLRRDRNHPSIIAWSVGNEVGEQYTEEAGAAIARILVDIAHEEDPTRPVTASMNYAKPNMPCKKMPFWNLASMLPIEFDILSLNYQGEGIRDAPAYAHLAGIKTSPLYGDFHKAFPNKMLLASESAAALSTRGTYIFPVTDGNSAPVNDTNGGGNSTTMQASAYELYSADFGSSPDKVFTAQDNNSFVAGEFVWSGWDYLGEPTPYYSARSSYFGIIDMAGFKKDRFYLYQSRWRADLPMAHILPHWTWPNRVGKVTPIHVFSSGDEAELFLNDKSQGRKKKAASEYRFRWDDIKYQAGEIRVVTYKNGKEWAEDSVKTAGQAAQLILTADRTTITADGIDLSFISVKVVDDKGNVVPEADNTISFSVSGPGEIVATDNGNPVDFVSFPSKERKAFNGLALAIVRTKAGQSGKITVTATSKGLQDAQTKVDAH